MDLGQVIVGLVMLGVFLASTSVLVQLYKKRQREKAAEWEREIARQRRSNAQKSARARKPVSPEAKAKMLKRQEEMMNAGMNGSASYTDLQRRQQ